VSTGIVFSSGRVPVHSTGGAVRDASLPSGDSPSSAEDAVDEELLAAGLRHQERVECLRNGVEQIRCVRVRDLEAHLG
jgi:hypothetical protein